MYEKIKSMPKAELHCHLDGSIPINTLKKLAKKEGIDPAQMDRIPVSDDVENLAEYLESFTYALEVLQSKENLKIATESLIQEVSLENVKYLEIRFAPLLHIEQESSVEEVIQGVIEGVKEASQKYDVEVRLIVICMRHHTNEENAELVRLVNELNGDYLSAYDFAGNEVDGANDTIEPVINEMSDKFSLTLHSGECGCVHNVFQAIHLGAKRIGHGIVMKDHLDDLSLIKEKDVHLELCPTSNIQTKAIETIDELPIHEFLEENISFSINTDNRTVSNTTLTDEFYKVQQAFELDMKDLKRITSQSIQAAFLEESQKEKLHDKYFN